MILEVLKPSRKRVSPGDIFALKPIDHDYFFGRVVETNARAFGDGCILIYIYKATSKSPEDIPPLRLGEFLINPIIINRLPWSRGYFQTVGNEPLTEENRYKVHCFKGFGSPTGLVDEFDRPILDDSYKPFGLLALSSFRTADIRIGDALGYDPDLTG